MGRRRLILAAILILNTGCASMFSAFERREKICRACNEATQSRAKHQERHQSQWDQWDKKYVSDDVILVEIVETKQALPKK